ncbi:hypothetical protein C8R44DRAFT_836642 [Mycena epipterygia]|nr:hypothetical protein C8R44DRAFT_836642 [Mycena epipterygia]
MAAKARNIHDDSFGSLSIVVAGDFAQLPPMTGPALYSGAVTLQVSEAMTQKNQNAVLGKILWHQFNTVVILRQNMRQKSQSEQDDKLRAALENMRYGACTEVDVAFLRTRIAGFRPENPKLFDIGFRNVSVITALNAQKDVLNRLGAERFARDNRKTLIESRWIISGGRVVNTGKLPLCVGMPLMIRTNDATELCITKGQGGVVVGWGCSETGKYDEQILETLFIQDLPVNVVPLTRTVTHIHQQVVGLINFGMTDYTSQGKSRDQKPGRELAHCKDHKAYYVALSRGFTAEGTIIMQDFDERKNYLWDVWSFETGDERA